ncbi:MAG: hypothetical protein HC895_22375 [Leptolyngbyaceae cyanobacterium SM1_3_5]|nr:hypothetical protein [Leptolyngbyaceae cyanobacterium SM1_3_5]
MPAGRFAEQLQQRYQPQSIATHAEMELRRSTPALSFRSSHHQHTQVNVAPRLQLTLLHSTLLAPAQAAATVAESMIRSSHTTFLERQSQRQSRQLQRIEQIELLVRQLQRDRTETVLQQELVQRIVDRTMRMETVRMETVAVSRAIAPPLTPQPPPMEFATVQPVPQGVRAVQSAELIAPEVMRSTPLSASPAASGSVLPAVP